MKRHLPYILSALLGGGLSMCYQLIPPLVHDRHRGYGARLDCEGCAVWAHDATVYVDAARRKQGIAEVGS